MYMYLLPEMTPPVTIPYQPWLQLAPILAQ